LRVCGTDEGCGTDRGAHRQYEHAHFGLLPFRALQPTTAAALKVGRHWTQTA
jgi:hypothetical protein